ncbi:MAG: immunoglobulin domain-containing protein [Chthoniobacterales bacterium]|nr:immunoglobulin domain-containing protein [Chthoniobacterales bacterium]
MKAGIQIKLFFSVLITYLLYISTSLAQNLTLTSLPTANTNNQVIVFPRQTVLLNATLSGNASSIIWQFNSGSGWINLGSRTRPANNFTFSISSSISYAGQYRAVLANNTTIQSNTINLVVQPQSLSWNSSNNLTVSIGGTLQLNLSGFAPANSTVTWYANGSRLSNSTNVTIVSSGNNSSTPNTFQSTLTISNFAQSNYGTYYAVVTSIADSTTLPTLSVLPANLTAPTNVLVYNVRGRAITYDGSSPTTSTNLNGYAVIQENSTSANAAALAFIWIIQTGNSTSKEAEIYQNGISVHNTASINGGYKIITRSISSNSSPGYEESESFFLIGQTSPVNISNNTTIFAPITYTGQINTITYENPSTPWRATAEVTSLVLNFNRAETINATTFNQTVQNLTNN